MREETGRVGPIELHEIKLLEEQVSVAKGNFTCLPILPGLLMG